MSAPSRGRIAVSMGDMNGIGPEVALKTLSLPEFEETGFVVTGSFAALQWWVDRLQSPLKLHAMSAPDDHKPGCLGVWGSLDSDPALPQPGALSQLAGEIALRAIEDGVRLCLDGQAAALVTAPVSKEAIALAGSKHPGHTEYLAELTGTPEDETMMLLAGEELRVGLATIHEPLSAVAALVTTDRIVRHLQILHDSLKRRFGMADPVIDVLGLNPHAGDGGVIGREEIEVIRPALALAEAQKIKVRGPFPADGYFGSRSWKQSDAVLAMYHDQGLIPFKLLAFETGVNVTLGLPIVRTSPDHGTAFGIAGRNLADPSSFLHAVRLAIRMSSH